MKKIIILLLFFTTCRSNKEIQIVQLEPDEFSIFKMLRIESVKEFPEAFGSTYEEEMRLSDEDWLHVVFIWKNIR